MRRFRFRLAALLRLRSQQERAARRALAAATADAAAVEQRIAAAEDGLRQCEDQSRGNGAEARLARALGEGLRRHRFRLEHERRAAEARLDRARTEWLEQRQQERALGHLRARRRAAWLGEQARAEQREVDDLSRALKTAAGASGEERQ